MVLSGRCLCGAVRFAVDGDCRDVFDCHCVRCRRFTGHHMAATSAAHADISVEDHAALTWYPPADGGGVEYGFCRRCGSSMFWRASRDADAWSIAAGTLDPPTGLRTAEAWWVSAASDYFERARPGVDHDRDGDQTPTSG